MLPPFIIEQIRQREEKKRWEDQPRLELPLDGFPPRGPRAEPEADIDAPPRGVAILEL